MGVPHRRGYAICICEKQPDGSLKVEYERYGTRDSVKPLVTVLDFHGIRDVPPELSEDFRHCHSLWFDRATGMYIKFDDAGEETVIARAILEDWHRDYNEVRPHTSLGDRTPREYAAMLEAEGDPSASTGQAAACPDTHSTRDDRLEMHHPRGHKMEST